MGAGADGTSIGCLVHDEGDDVAVAVRDLEPGEVSVAWLDSGRRDRLSVNESVPLGHKVALSEMPEGHKVIEYGVLVALTRSEVAAGAHVHVHNIRSARWQQSA